MALKILTVDDSRTIRMIVKKAFGAYECELFEAENGVEGLALASKEKPDLIILDITMPVMTGIEMLTKLKETSDLKTIPVIMLTAESGKDNVMNIVKMGVKDYIVKPFKGEQLIERAAHIINLKQRIDIGAATQDEKDANYFSARGDIVILSLPSKINRSVTNQIDAAVKNQINAFSSAGLRKIIIDISNVSDLGMTAIQLVIALVNTFVRSKMVVHLVATDQHREALKGFQETGSIPTLATIEEAQAAF